MAQDLNRNNLAVRWAAQDGGPKSAGRRGSDVRFTPMTVTQAGSTEVVERTSAPQPPSKGNAKHTRPGPPRLHSARAVQAPPVFYSESRRFMKLKLNKLLDDQAIHNLRRNHSEELLNLYLLIFGNCFSARRFRAAISAASSNPDSLARPPRQDPMMFLPLGGRRQDPLSAYGPPGTIGNGYNRWSQCGIRQRLCAEVAAVGSVPGERMPDRPDTGPGRRHRHGAALRPSRSGSRPRSRRIRPRS